MTASLAERLRDETRALHTEIERSPLMHALLRGELGLATYCQLLRNLHAIYVELETALTRHADDALVAPIFALALFRSGPLARDLNTLYGPSWEHAIPLQPACQLYVDRLRQLEKTRPALLVAHAYVRYLGDLSGGQLLKRIVAKSFRLAPGEGIAFYVFGNLDQTLAMTRAFRAGLEHIGLGEEDTHSVVTEARQAFELHGSLFTQLAAAGSVAGAPAR